MSNLPKSTIAAVTKLIDDATRISEQLLRGLRPGYVLDERIIERVLHGDRAILKLLAAYKARNRHLSA